MNFSFPGARYPEIRKAFSVIAAKAMLSEQRRQKQQNCRESDTAAIGLDKAGAGWYNA